MRHRLIILFCLVLTSTCTAQEHWSEFRGHDGTGISRANLPVDLSNPAHVKWRVPIHGKGWSSPVVWDNQIWLTTATPDGKTMSVLCVDRMTGKVLLDRVLHQNRKPAFCHATNSYASPTPAVDAENVYLHFGSYGTTCLDRETFKQKWQRTDLECDHHRGPASSPILAAGKLVVAFDGFDQQYVIALDVETGKTVWRRDREIEYGTDNGDLKKAYGTGTVVEVKGQTAVVYPSAVATIAYDLETGETIWTVYHGGMNASARPQATQAGNLILTNGMGRMISVDPKGRGTLSASHIQWMNRQGIAKKSTPLVIGERIYQVSDQGIALCLDTKTGNKIWQERLGGSFSSSPVCDGERIFVFGENGEAHVFKPGDRFQRLGRAKFPEGFKATPAISGNQLIVRSFKHLFCFEKSR